MTSPVGPSAATSATPLATAILEQVSRRIVGQQELTERLLIALLTGGHVLLEGVPGLAKTLTVRTLAETVRTTFRRIQFTPDLLPADVIGTQLFDQVTNEVRIKRGPIFANIILADEINRAPAKVQSALLEAMQEHQVTIAGESLPLPDPFLVLATQNPIEQEGTYPLPEAQIDRFMLKVRVDYPTRDEEREIMARMASGAPIPIEPVATPEQLLATRATIAAIHLDPLVADYIVALVHATRRPLEAQLPALVPWLEGGASPRASLAMAQGARAHAYLRGRAYVTPDDVRAIAPDVLRHRLRLSFEAEAEEVTADDVISRLLKGVPTP